MKRVSYRETELIRDEYRERGALIRARLAEFAAVPEEEYFYELLYCLLTPQSSAVNAGTAVARLKAMRFREDGGDPAGVLRQPDAYIRFHNTKAHRLHMLREQFPAIAARIAAVPRDADTGAARALRAWLVASVNGLGMKEASHVLRNIGYRNLAILDRHILRNLRRHGALRSVPAALTVRRYLAIEQRFRDMADALGIGMDELDLLFWSRQTGEILK